MNDIILFFGSFNPIHNGHTAVAGYVLEQGIADELWFVVSPRNPMKADAGLACDEDRLEMAGIAVREKMDGLNVKVCDIEFSLPRPSYTIDTMHALSAGYPGRKFSILAGTDILRSLGQWKNSAELLASYRFLIYPREGYPYMPAGNGFTYLENAPRWNYSSTDVRRTFESGGDIGAMVSPGVLSYIEKNEIWRQSGEILLIEELSRRIKTAGSDPQLYMERGKLYYKTGDFGKSLNDFLRALELEPDNTEARQYEKMLREIFEFRYMDYYNP